MPDKDNLRTQCRASVGALSPQQRACASREVCDRVMGLPEVAQASSVFCYVGVEGEVQTRELIGVLLAVGKTVLVPWFTEGEPAKRTPMHLSALGSLDDLAPGRWGIPSTPTLHAYDATPDVTLCPGVVFTRAGHRLGRGAAHYDRWLTGHPGTVPVGLCFEAQLVDALPTEPHDRPMAAVVTEAGVYRSAGPEPG